MRIFITGVAGFLGSHIADRMLERGMEVVGCDNLVGGYHDNVPDGVDFHYGDVANVELMRRLTAGCDIVYHAACTAYEGLSVFSPSLVAYNTYQATAAVLSAAAENRVRRFIQCSSMARYGAHDRVPFTEDMECKPQDPYGISKYAAELLAWNMAEIHGIELVIAVPHNIIGPRQKYDDPYRNVASIMVNRMLSGKQPVIYGDGQQMRCFSDVADDIWCLERIALGDEVVGEVINIGPDEEFVTIQRLAEMIAEKLEFSLDPIYMPGRPQEVKYATCSADKARRLLGYETEYSLSDSLDRLISYIRERGIRSFEYHLDLEIINEKTPRTWTDKLF